MRALTATTLIAVALAACQQPRQTADAPPTTVAETTVSQPATTSSTASVETSSQPQISSSPTYAASTAPVTNPSTTTTLPATSTTTAPDQTTISPPTISPPTSDAAQTGALNATDLLAAIPVEREHRGGYDRDLFAVWSDLDGDGCDTRQEVLIAESTSPVQIDQPSCTVIAGDWLSSYDAQTLQSPADIDIDHVVSLKEAWDSGAWQWSAEERVAYGNDLSDGRTLAAASSTSNSAKGDKDPSNWLPTDAAVCTYLADWIAIKTRWSLTMDESEHGRIRNILNGPCQAITVVPWPAPIVPAITTPAATPATVAAVPPGTTTSPAPSVTDPQFGSCKEAKANGYGPYIQGKDAEYDWYRDGDNDGTVCE